MKLDVTQLSETGSALNLMKQPSDEGPIRKTPLFGVTKQGDGMQRFEWPNSKDLDDLSFDENNESRVSLISFKESFGCLKAIHLTFGNEIESPWIEAGRSDRNQPRVEHFDMEDPVNLIRVRIHVIKGKKCITGIQLCYVDPSGHSEALGLVDLHDFGEWEEHRLYPGDQIIGIYGLMNNLIRGLGFVIMNSGVDATKARVDKGSILCCTGKESTNVVEPAALEGFTTLDVGSRDH